MNFDFYIYNRMDDDGHFITLHFSSTGLVQDHSSREAVLEAGDLISAYEGFCKSYEYITGGKYDR